MSSQQSKGSSGGGSGGPLAGCVILLHSSIPHLGKRGPVLQKRLQSLGASVLIPGPATSASSSKTSSKVSGRGGLPTTPGSQHATAQSLPRSRLSVGTNSAGSRMHGRSGACTTSTQSTAAAKGGAIAPLGHHPVTHIVVGQAVAEDETLLQSLVQQALGSSAGGHSEVLSPPKVVTDAWVDSLATTAKRVPSGPHTVEVTLPAAITTPPAAARRPAGVQRLATSSHSAGSQGSAGQPHASSGSAHQQQEEGPQQAAAGALVPDKPRWSIDPACQPAPDAPFARCVHASTVPLIACVPRLSAWLPSAQASLPANRDETTTWVHGFRYSIGVHLCVHLLTCCNHWSLPAGSLPGWAGGTGGWMWWTSCLS
jgi:hypothetical protein